MSAPATDRFSAGEAWAWSLLGWIGLLLLGLGLVDGALYWLPAHWSSPDWLFDAVSATAAALPLPTLGIAALLGAALARRRLGQLRLLGALLMLLALALVAAYIAFLHTLPPTERAIRGAGAIAAAATARIVARTGVMVVLFTPACFVASLVALNASRGARRPPPPADA